MASLVGDTQALDLFSRCSLLVLPYMGATQSALIPAAYFFHKPVLASPSGALTEYVRDGVTGWIVEPGHTPSLARCLSMALKSGDRLRWMGQQGRSWYNRRRQAEEQALLGMYESLAERGSRWSPRVLGESWGKGLGRASGR